ncbi:MAG: hypothetical protein V3S41_04230 [Spirochaetia bacterium]
MRYVTRQLVFPEGDTREIGWSLSFGQLVDVAGSPLSLPVSTVRMLAFRVRRISTDETRNEEITSYFLEQLFPEDLAAYSDAPP